MMAHLQDSTFNQEQILVKMCGSFTKKVKSPLPPLCCHYLLPLSDSSHEESLFSYSLISLLFLFLSSYFFFLISYFPYFLLFSLSGGYCCYDEAVCFARAKSSPQLTSSKTWPANVSMSAGIFSDNSSYSPTFYNANKVYMGYAWRAIIAIGEKKEIREWKKWEGTK